MSLHPIFGVTGIRILRHTLGSCEAYLLQLLGTEVIILVSVLAYQADPQRLGDCIRSTFATVSTPASIVVAPVVDADLLHFDHVLTIWRDTITLLSTCCRTGPSTISLLPLALCHSPSPAPSFVAPTPVYRDNSETSSTNPSMRGEKAIKDTTMNFRLPLLKRIPLALFSSRLASDYTIALVRLILVSLDVFPKIGKDIPVNTPQLLHSFTVQLLTEVATASYLRSSYVVSCITPLMSRDRPTDISESVSIQKKGDQSRESIPFQTNRSWSDVHPVYHTTPLLTMLPEVPSTWGGESWLLYALHRLYASCPKEDRVHYPSLHLVKELGTACITLETSAIQCTTLRTVYEVLHLRTTTPRPSLYPVLSAAPLMSTNPDPSLSLTSQQQPPVVSLPLHQRNHIAASPPSNLLEPALYSCMRMLGQCLISCDLRSLPFAWTLRSPPYTNSSTLPSCLSRLDARNPEASLSPGDDSSTPQSTAMTLLPSDRILYNPIHQRIADLLLTPITGIPNQQLKHLHHLELSLFPRLHSHSPSPSPSPSSAPTHAMARQPPLDKIGGPLMVYPRVTMSNLEVSIAPPNTVSQRDHFDKSFALNSTGNNLMAHTIHQSTSTQLTPPSISTSSSILSSTSTSSISTPAVPTPSQLLDSKSTQLVSTHKHSLSHASSSAVMDCLVSLGINVLSASNNHAGDSGPLGITASLIAANARHLYGAGIGTYTDRHPPSVCQLSASSPSLSPPFQPSASVISNHSALLSRGYPPPPLPFPPQPSRSDQPPATYNNILQPLYLLAFATHKLRDTFATPTSPGVNELALTPITAKASPSSAISVTSSTLSVHRPSALDPQPVSVPRLAHNTYGQATDQLWEPHRQRALRVIEDTAMRSRVVGDAIHELANAWGINNFDYDINTKSSRGTTVVYLHNHHWPARPSMQNQRDKLGSIIESKPSRPKQPEESSSPTTSHPPLPFTPPWSQLFARDAVISGADVFFSHGQPRLQGIELIRLSRRLPLTNSSTSSLSAPPKDTRLPPWDPSTVSVVRPLLHGLGNFLFQSRSLKGRYGSDSWESALVDIISCSCPCSLPFNPLLPLTKFILTMLSSSPLVCPFGCDSTRRIPLYLRLTPLVLNDDPLLPDLYSSSTSTLPPSPLPPPSPFTHPPLAFQHTRGIPSPAPKRDAVAILQRIQSMCDDCYDQSVRSQTGQQEANESVNISLVGPTKSSSASSPQWTSVSPLKVKVEMEDITTTTLDVDFDEKDIASRDMGKSETNHRHRSPYSLARTSIPFVEKTVLTTIGWIKLQDHPLELLHAWHSNHVGGIKSRL